ncbi:MAG: hypothetical protein ACM31P_12550 [Actinomycetota bacterium]
MDRFAFLSGRFPLGVFLCSAILAGAVGAIPAGPALAQDDPASALAQGDAGDRIYFSPGTDEVDEAGMKLLLASAVRLKNDPRLVLRLTAYTANAGSRSYNLAVADEEINTVTGLLRTFGVPIRQIRREGAGGILAAKDCVDQDCKEARFVILRYD